MDALPPFVSGLGFGMALTSLGVALWMHFPEQYPGLVVPLVMGAIMFFVALIVTLDIY